MKRLAVNLATVPSVNRAVPMAAASVVLGAAFLMTAFNVASFLLLGGEYRTERRVLKEQEARIEALGKDLVGKEQVLRSASVASFSDEARYVGQLLDEKRYSWVRFLECLESVKAYGCMFQSVTPQVDSGGVVRVTLRGVANPRSELLKFEQNLFASPRFKEVQLSTEQREPGNPMINFSLSCVYVPEKPDAP